MGKRGSIPKKISLKVLSGEASITKANLGVLPVCDLSNVDAPVSFGDDEKKVWAETIDKLKCYRPFEKIDTAILEAFCLSYVAWHKTQDELRKIEKDKSFLASILTRGAGTSIAINPLMILNSKLKAETITYAAQLGLTPASRLRIESGKLENADKKVNIFKKLSQEVK